MATIQTRIGGGIRSLASGRYRVAVLVVLLNLLLIGVFFTVVQDQEQARARAEFQTLATTYVAAIQSGIDGNLEVLEAVGGLFAASPAVGRQDFRAFVEGPLSRRQELQAISWNQRVKDADRAAYEAAARNDGLPSFQITERTTQGQMGRAQRRAEHISVTYIEPLIGNEAAVGFDVASNATRLKALDSSRDTGEMVATARITLVQETKEQFGVLILKPIYKSGTPHETVEHRRESLAGFAVGVLRIGDMLEASLRDLPKGSINIQLADQKSPVGERFLYLHQPNAEVDSPTEARNAIDMRAALDVPGRQWSLLLTPTSEFIAGQRSFQSWGVLGGGLFVTVLLVAYLIGVINHAAKIERLAAELTKSNEDLDSETTERTLAVESLEVERALRARVDNFVTIASHELRTPMTTIVGYSELLLEHEPRKDVRREWFQLINDEGRRLTVILDELLDISRINAGTVQVNMQRLALPSLARDRVQGLELVSTNHQFELEASNDVPDVIGDRDKLLQVLGNLLDNAVKYSPEGGKISVEFRLDEERSRVITSVRDQGIGIAPRDQAHVFEMFQRARPDEAVTIRGTGVGLHVVKSYVELMGGAVWVSSRRHHGSAFSFALPIAKQAPQEGAVAAAS